MPREFSRHERVASLLQRELAALLQNQRDYLQLGIVTVSAVEVTRDMSVATVYITVLGVKGDDLTEELVQLQNAAGFLRKELGQGLRLRVIPELRFKHDDSIDNGMRMDKLLKDIHVDDE
ncbi:MAG: 30S ribosome-binding factor RbfA [Gammaproteobacteria bacterium]|nr:30S ribosome-binding factor RbfA [Gammaproteobacteria bacterium]